MLHSLGWILSVTASGAVYMILTYFFPVPIIPGKDTSSPLKWEYLANQDGFLDVDLPWSLAELSAPQDDDHDSTIRSIGKESI